MSKVVIAQASDETASEVISGMVGRFNIDWQGMKVLVKPNMLGHFNFDENSGATTHPAVIQAVVRTLGNQGATVVVGDNPALQGLKENQRCARRSGILEASEGTYLDISEDKVEMSVNHSSLLDRIVVSREVMDADYVVYVPRFKTHIFTTISGAVKNMFGIVVGGDKP